MNFSIFKHKLELKKRNKKKELKINKYFLYQFENWSGKKIQKHNNKVSYKTLKKCIITKKRKKLSLYSNISTHYLKKLVSNGDLPNFKKALW